MKKYIIICIIALVLVVSTILIIKMGNKTFTYEYNNYTETGTIEKNTLTYSDTSKVTNYVKIDTSKGLIFVELYPSIAPKTVDNFKSLVRSKYYQNMTFHRVIQNFMIQTGDPTGTGNGGSPRTIKGEFTNNGFENNLSHTRGVISMARQSGNMDSASSQFFIVQADSTFLDGDYAGFGKVIAGMEVVDKIATVKTDDNDKPIATIELNNISFVNIK